MDASSLIDTKLTRAELVDLMVHEALLTVQAELAAVRKGLGEIKEPEPLTLEEAVALFKANAKTALVDGVEHGDEFVRVRVTLDDVKATKLPGRFAIHDAAVQELRTLQFKLEAVERELGSKGFRNEALKALLGETNEGRELVAMLKRINPHANVKLLSGKK